MWLSEQQLAEYTRRTKPSAQRKVLDRALIPYRLVDGRPVVLVSDLSPTATRRKNEVRLQL